MDELPDQHLLCSIPDLPSEVNFPDRGGAGGTSGGGLGDGGVQDRLRTLETRSQTSS